MWRRQLFRPLFNLFFFPLSYLHLQGLILSYIVRMWIQKNSPGMMKVELCVWFSLMAFLADTTASLKAGAFLFAYHSQGVKKPKCLLVGLCQCYLKQALSLQMEFSCLAFLKQWENFSDVAIFGFDFRIKNSCSWRGGGKWKFFFKNFYLFWWVIVMINSSFQNYCWLPIFREILSLHQEWLGTPKSLLCVLNVLDESKERSLKECVVLLGMWLTALLLKLDITTDNIIYI